MNLINTENTAETILPVFSSIVVVLLIFASVFLFFYSSNKKWHSLKKNEMVILFTIYMIVVLLLRVMSEVPYFTLIPLSVFPMLVSLLISRRVALLLNCFVSIIGCFVFNGDVEFLLYFLLYCNCVFYLCMFAKFLDFALLRCFANAVIGRYHGG